MLTEHYKDAIMQKVFRDLARKSLKEVYPQLSCLACLGLVIPYSTVDCEHAFSAMKRVKTTVYLETG